MMAKIWDAGTTCVAAATTCPSSGFPAISCSTLGYFDFRRVPLPAARIAIANLLSLSLISGKFSRVRPVIPTVLLLTASDTLARAAPPLQGGEALSRQFKRPA